MCNPLVWRTSGVLVRKLDLFRLQKRNLWMDPDVDIRGMENIAFVAGYQRG